MIDEDPPPNVLPDTLPPMAEVDSRMVAMSLSSMATTLEILERTISRQHDRVLDKLEKLQGAANLAGSIANRALDEITDLREAMTQLTQSVRGLEEASRSLIDTVYPERSPTMPPELADVVHIRRQVMTGE